MCSQKHNGFIKGDCPNVHKLLVVKVIYEFYFIQKPFAFKTLYNYYFYMSNHS